MIAISRLRVVLVCLAGIATAGTVLAQSPSPRDVAPQAGCGRWGYGPGPGMMGGAGYGPGMMGSGAGPGMMRGYGMGPGMMAPGGWGGGLDLTDEVFHHPVVVELTDLIVELIIIDNVGHISVSL